AQARAERAAAVPDAQRYVAGPRPGRGAQGDRGRRRHGEPRARARDARDPPPHARALRDHRPRPRHQHAWPRHVRGRHAVQGRDAGRAPAAVGRSGREGRTALRGMRKRIAETMPRSVQTAAHFTYGEEIDMPELVLVRDPAKARAAEGGVKLNYLPFIVKAVV